MNDHDVAACGHSNRWTYGSGICLACERDALRLRVAELEAEKNKQRPTSCQCTLAQRLVGDGCDICNPREALSIARERIHELEADNARLRTAAKVIQLSGLPTWEDLRGCAPDATGGLSSEDFVRRLRNEW